MSGPRTEVFGPMVRTVSALGPNCLGAELSGHFGNGAEVSIGSEVLSWVRYP